MTETILENETLTDVFDTKGTNSSDYKRMMEAVEALDFTSPKAGTIIQATYVGSTEKEYLFDIGYKDYIRVERKGDEVRSIQNLETGSAVNVMILQIKDRPVYTIKGSVAALAEQEAKVSMNDKMRNDISVTAKVKEMNPAGYMLEVVEKNATLLGFMPNTLAGANRITDPSSIVGQSMEVMIESYSNEKGTYILSRKKYLESLTKEAIEELEIGQIETPYVGRITGSTNFGVFVEFNGCLTGMIYEANFNKEALETAGIKSFQDIPAGTSIEFYVKEILKNNRIILTQTFNPSLWDTIKVNDELEGTIRFTKSFGTLVKLDGETQGLIPSSVTEKIKTELKNGDVVKVKVTSIKKNERKINLTLA